MLKLTAIGMAAALAVSVLGAAELPTIYLAGDSTVCDYKPEQAPMTGWGQALRDFCKPGVTVRNLAVGGRSTKSFQDEGRWKKLLAQLKPGDFVLIQFGHNDQKKDRPALYAEAGTDYRANLEKFVQEVRAEQATPVLCTPVNRRSFPNGVFRRSLAEYPEVVREVGRKTGTAVLDLNAATEKLFLAEGVEGTVKYFTIGRPRRIPRLSEGSEGQYAFFLPRRGHRRPGSGPERTSRSSRSPDFSSTSNKGYTHGSRHCALRHQGRQPRKIPADSERQHSERARRRRLHPL